MTLLAQRQLAGIAIPGMEIPDVSTHAPGQAACHCYPDSECDTLPVEGRVAVMVSAGALEILLRYLHPIVVDLDDHFAKCLGDPDVDVPAAALDRILEDIAHDSERPVGISDRVD